MSKKKPSAPKVSPLATIKFRVDEFFASNDAASGDASSIQQHLDTLTQGLKPEQFFSFFLYALKSTPNNVVEHLHSIVPAWIAQHNYTNNLKQYLVKEAMSGQRYSAAENWLRALAADISTEVTAKTQAASNLFIEAYSHADSEWQSSVVGFWYTDKRKYQQHGFSILIDRNPPWNGAIKDFMVVDARSADGFKSHIRNTFNGYNAPKILPRTDVELKEILLKALNDSKKAGIRLPQDLKEEKDLFWNFLQMLPSDTGTPSISREEYDEQFRIGRSNAELRKYENTVGREIIDENGKKVFIGADFANMMMGNISDEEFLALPKAEQRNLILDSLGNPETMSTIQAIMDRDAELEEELKELTTDELWKRLQDAGFTDSQEILREKARVSYSNIDVAMEYSETIDAENDEDDSILLNGIPIMCSRLLPNVLFVEDVINAVNERIERLYEWFEEGENYVEMLEDWVFVWEKVKSFIEQRNAMPDGKSIHSFLELEMAFEHYNSMEALFSEDLTDITDTILYDYPRHIPTLKRMFEEILDVLNTKEEEGRLNILLDLAQIYAFEGNSTAMEKVYGEAAHEFPKKYLVYSCWAEELANPTNDTHTKNPTRAIEILQQGLAVEGVDDAEYLEELLEDIRQEAGL
ncbi:MAG: hypothetical protein MUF71_14585 [Candidatus Kapabacteria bacterium]|jgi:hypothetical protein|nr:hypothetical protein [Candidatus Kapabacteria bacterium]